MQPSFLNAPLGLTSIDAMSTARVALVPARENPARPAWPQTLDALRRLQLPEGGWGDAAVYNAYDRFGCTLAALRALLEWHQSQDTERIARGRAALDSCARDLQREDRDLVGFEFITDRLLQELEGFGVSIDIDLLGPLAAARQKRLAYLGALEVDPQKPRSWWFSMECLSDAALVHIDPSLVSPEGGLVTATGATAAYLRAVRLAGTDSPAATQYLDTVVEHGRGGAGFCWPLDNSQLIWSLDAYLKVGIQPSNPRIRPSIEMLHQRWLERPSGIGLSPHFPVRDGDDIALGYSVLRRAGYELSGELLEACWNGRLMESYTGERVNSLSVNIHALHALKYGRPRGSVYVKMTNCILEWLREQITSDSPLVDPWHVSPTYVLGRGLSVFPYYDEALARRCVDRLLSAQDASGGWGFAGPCTEEETAHAVLGLLEARSAGLLGGDEPLRRAARFLAAHASNMHTRPRLWLAKTLYLPVNMVEAFVDAARLGLGRAGMEG